MGHNIKTAEEILRDNDYVNHHDKIDPILIDILKEYAEQFIDLAADKAFINVTHGYDDWEELNNAVFEKRIKINKQSILEIKNLIK